MLIQQASAGIPTGPSFSESGIVCHSAYVELHHSSIERALSAKLAVKHKAMSYSWQIQLSQWNTSAGICHNNLLQPYTKSKNKYNLVVTYNFDLYLHCGIEEIKLLVPWP
jgi:hypothetical protein